MGSDEAKLIRRLKKRDEAAFTEMVRMYQDRVFALVYRMLGDRAEAEDLSQEIFVTVFKAIDQFRGDSKFSTWLYRVATNHCKNRIKYLSRRHHQRKKDIADTMESEFSGQLIRHAARPDQMAEGRQLEVTIQKGLAAIDPDHREVLILRDVEHLSYQEISEILGIAEGTVKSRLFRARAALKTEIESVYK